MSNQKITICITGIAFFVVNLLSIQIVYAGSKPEIIAGSGEKIFLAGAATGNITPILGGGIVGGWSTPPATHIHDELHVRCLVLDDGETRLAFVVVDLIGLNRDLIDETKRLIKEETNIPEVSIMISATHTHSATSAQGEGNRRREWTVGEPFDDYQEFVIRRIADVVRVAINNLEPARIGWGVGSVPQHVFVRRWKMKPGTVIPNPLGGYDKVRTNPGRNNPDLLVPAGEPDHEVAFISVQSANGRPLALFANYSLHYVGGVPPGHISADYFGIFADRIGELLGADRQDPPFVGIMSNGTSGNVNNINFGGRAESYQPYEKMRMVADDVAREVLKIYNTIQHHDWVSLQSAQGELTLKVRKPCRQMIERAEWVLSRPDTVTMAHQHEKVYAERILQLLGWPDEVTIILQAFRIGELGVATSPFETFAETGLELKAKSPFKPSFIISLAHGYYGYLPTPEQHELGGYETWLSTSRVELEASGKISAKLLELLGKLK
jgi:neutral ceramidase